MSINVIVYLLINVVLIDSFIPIKETTD